MSGNIQKEILLTFEKEVLGCVCQRASAAGIRAALAQEYF